MRKILFKTDDIYLFEKLRILLSPEFALESYGDEEDFEIRVETAITEDGGRKLLIMRGAETLSLPLPAPLRAIKAAFDSPAARVRLRLSGNDGQVFLDGEKIRLTDTELALLSLLYSGGGEFVSRETIREKIFPDSSDGALNVYVHYLREKLEGGGEKIIISSRTGGYRLNKSFLGGNENAQAD